MEWAEPGNSYCTACIVSCLGQDYASPASMYLILHSCHACQAVHVQVIFLATNTCIHYIALIASIDCSSSQLSCNETVASTNICFADINAHSSTTNCCWLTQAGFHQILEKKFVGKYFYKLCGAKHAQNFGVCDLLRNSNLWTHVPCLCNILFYFWYIYILCTQLGITYALSYVWCNDIIISLGASFPPPP